MGAVNVRKDDCRECYPWEYPGEGCGSGLLGWGVQGPVGTLRGLRGRTWGIAEELGAEPWGVAYLGDRGAEVDAGARPGTTSQDAERIRRLEADKPRAGGGRTRSQRSASVVFRGRHQAARPADPRDESTPTGRRCGACAGSVRCLSAPMSRSPRAPTCAAMSRPPSARAVRDQALKAEIGRVHEDNYCAGGGPQHGMRCGAGPRPRPGMGMGHAAPAAPRVRLMRAMGLHGHRPRQITAYHAQRC